jgi:hypothetical protein
MRRFLSCSDIKHFYLTHLNVNFFEFVNFWSRRRRHDERRGRLLLHHSLNFFGGNAESRQVDGSLELELFDVRQNDLGAGLNVCKTFSASLPLLQ